MLDNKVERLHQEYKQDSGERIIKDGLGKNKLPGTPPLQIKRRQEEKKVVSFMRTTPVRVKKISQNRPVIEESMTAKRQTDVHGRGRLKVIDEIPELPGINRSLIASSPPKSNEIKNKKVIESNNKSYSQLLQSPSTNADGFHLTPGSDESSVMYQVVLHQSQKKKQEIDKISTVPILLILLII